MQECVSEFISFITSEASERCHQEKRKTINGEDILFAMSTLGFDMYVEPLKLYLQKFREVRHNWNRITSYFTHVPLFQLLVGNLNHRLQLMMFSYLLFFQAMKGEKGIPGVSVGEGLGEDLTDDSFCTYEKFNSECV